MEASIESICELTSWAEAATRSHGELNSTAINGLLVCLEELVANIALYGTHDNVIPTVRIALNIKNGLVEVVIEDDGPAFDPVGEPEPDVLETDLDFMTVGGRGLRIVRNLAREMSYERVNGWNCNRLVFV